MFCKTWPLKASVEKNEIQRKYVYFLKWKKQEYILHTDWRALINGKRSRNRKRGIFGESIEHKHEGLKTFYSHFQTYVPERGMFSSTSSLQSSDSILPSWECLRCSFPLFTPLDLRIFKGEMLGMLSIFQIQSLPGPGFHMY